MPVAQRTTRKYDSSRRQAQAQVTRARILAAARDLFIERGYGGTTLAAIAEHADIALPTVYAAAGSKRAILAELIEGRENAELPVQILYSEDVDAIAEAPDAGSAIRAFADRATKHLEAAYELLVAMRAAAGVEVEASDLERRVQQQRLDDLRDLVRRLNARGLLSAKVPAPTAAETLWTLTDLQVFHMLVQERGWSTAKFRKWLAALTTAYLLS